MSKVLIRVAPKFRPVSGDLIGLRLQATLPNLAARKMVKTSKGFAATETMVPAFRKPYLVSETGDCMVVSESDLLRFQKRLKWEGFEEFEMLTDLNGRKPEESASPEVAASIAEMQRKINEAVKAAKEA